jgi:dolichol-phosphate mannosyltransferase
MSARRASASASASFSSSSSSSSALPTYSVLLPTFNEAENLPLIVGLLERTFVAAGLGERFQVVVVEDSSPDGTFEVALELQRALGGGRVVEKAERGSAAAPESRGASGKLDILKRRGKEGLGTAYIEGLALCRGDFVVLMDADLSHHPKFIPQMIALQARDNLDVVSGTRYRAGGGVHGWDLKRKLISRVANFLATTMLNPRASDLTGSFRLYRKSVLQAVMPRVKSRGYVFQMEVIVRCRQIPGLTIGEVPITFVDRVYGESKMGASEITQYIKGLWNLFLEVDV